MAAMLGIETSLDKGQEGKAGWQSLARKTGLFILFLFCAIAVFVFGSNYYSIFPTNGNILYEGSIAAFFLIVTLLLRWQPRFQAYWQIAYAFFVAAAVILVTSLAASPRDVLFRSIGILAGTNQEAGVGKVFEALVTIATILLLSWLAGMRPQSLYVRRGNLRWGLVLGIGLLVNFSSSSLMFFSGRFTDLETLGSVIVWGMIFSFANGFLEELWLRGQFLGKLEPLLGSGTAIILTTFWWSLFHIGAVYMQPAAIPFYLANLVTFGLAYGYVMHKTDSWIAPGLMHAAADFFLFVAMLSSA